MCKSRHDLFPKGFEYREHHVPYNAFFNAETVDIEGKDMKWTLILTFIEGCLSMTGTARQIRVTRSVIGRILEWV